MTQEQYELEQDYLSNQEEWENDEEQGNIMGLAIVKAHAFSQEYNPTTGRAEDKPNYHALKEGYTAGFLAGFTYKFTGDKDI
jgi:hypothetical protein